MGGRRGRRLKLNGATRGEPRHTAEATPAYVGGRARESGGMAHNEQADPNGATASAITVVIPTHNRQALLLRAVDSVLRQRDVIVDVVVVDDGSLDGSSDAIRRLPVPNVRVIRHDRSRGVAAARNAGLAAAKAPWVAFVDDDDFWAPDKLASQLSALGAHYSARWSCVGALHVDSDLQVGLFASPPPSGDVSASMLLGNAIPGGGSGLLVETNLAVRVGGFDESMSILADWDFNLRLSLASEVAAVDRPLLAYYVHSDSMYHNPAGVMRELEYLETKHRDLPGGRRLSIDRGGWTIDLALMAHRLGDVRTARRLLVGTGTLTTARALVRRFRRLGWGPARRGNTGDTSHASRAVPEWLNRYA